MTKSTITFPRCYQLSPPMIICNPHLKHFVAHEDSLIKLLFCLCMYSHSISVNGDAIIVSPQPSEQNLGIIYSSLIS